MVVEVVFVLNLISFFLCFGMLVPGVAFAQSAAVAGQKPPQVGRVVVEESQIYSQASFDSPVIAVLKQGTVLKMSNRLFGAFYRVRLSSGQIGYIPDTDVRSKKHLAELKKIEQKARPPEARRYRGMVFNFLRFREETMESRPTAPMQMLGLRFFGPNLTEPGDYPMDLAVQVAWKAPGYYDSALGNTASGFLLLGDALFVSLFPNGKSVLSFLGVGPFLKYSHFDVATTNSMGIKTNYALDDVMLGLVFGIGVGVHFQKWQIRMDLKHYWERLMYTGLQMSVLHEF